MRQPRTSWRRSQMVNANAMMLASVSSAEGVASQPSRPEGDRDTPWMVHVRTMDEALAKKKISAAMRAWHHAYDAALESQHWEGLVEVANASLRIGDVAGLRKTSEVKARWIYLAALLRAREQRSLDGVLRTAEAFAALGDREVSARPPDC